MGYYHIMYNGNGYENTGAAYKLLKKEENKVIYDKLDNYIFYGRKVDDEMLSRKIYFRESDKGIFTDFVWLYGMTSRLVVSKRFLKLLQDFSLPKHQVIPIYLDETDEIFAYIINVYEAFDITCVDLDKSKFLKRTDDSISVHVPFFKENIIGDLDLFLYKIKPNETDYPRGPFISNRLRKALKKEKITGYSLMYRDSWYYDEIK